MAINKQTIISAFDDKLTLLQWLKTINKALDEAVLTGVEVRQKGNATYSFVVTFEDGTELESNQFVLAQGESINGATIRNGHLYLSLTNGDELDAGNVKPVTSFAINESQHLIVNYGDGTSQDLGAIFSGNVNIDGNFAANSIIENMSGYTMTNSSPTITTAVYGSAVKNGNKLTIAYAFTINKGVDGTGNPTILRVVLPATIRPKLIPWTDNILEQKSVKLFKTQWASVDLQVAVVKDATGLFLQLYAINNLDAQTNYYGRIEMTFLLSDNMVV